MPCVTARRCNIKKPPLAWLDQELRLLHFGELLHAWSTRLADVGASSMLPACDVFLLQNLLPGFIAPSPRDAS